MNAMTLLDSGEGILRLTPTWVPRSFGVPGRRLRLHPDDYYALGAHRGGISERWLASTVGADNGPLTAPGEGVSQVLDPDGGLTPFDEVVAQLGPRLIGERIWGDHHGWPMFAKLFDNLGPLPFHVHQDDARATLVGKRGKPEAYFYPPQLNNHLGTRPLSFLGLRPGTTREDLRPRLRDFGRAGDNRITELSVAYRPRLGAGWDIPAGVLHAPASLCTYEPQAASDVLSMWESSCGDQAIPEELLWRDIPAEHAGDLEVVLDLLDWDRNVTPDFTAEREMTPIPTLAARGDPDAPAREHWTTYRASAFSSSELAVRPRSSTSCVDQAAYGCLVIQGHGMVGELRVEAPTMLRFGRPSGDELFVSEGRAREGVTITNLSEYEPLVILKHFGPGNPDLAPALADW